MSIEKIKQQLENGREIQFEISELKKHLDALESELTAENTKAAKIEISDAEREKSLKLVEYKNTMDILFSIRCRDYNTSLKLIYTLPEPRLRRLMVLRYIDCLNWEEIAERLYVDVRHIHRLHRSALFYIDSALPPS